MILCNSDLSRLQFAADGERLELLPIEAGASGASGDGAKLRKFSVLAYTGGAMRPSGMSTSVVVALDGMKIPRQDLPVHARHDPSQVVGHTDSVTTTSQRLRATGVVSGVGEAAQEVLATAANGFPWQASIGVEVNKSQYVPEGESIKVNGRKFSGPIYAILESTLREISFVSMGADGATTSVIAHISPTPITSGGLMSFESWLNSQGIDPAKLTAGAKAALQAQFDSETKPMPTPAPTPAPAPATTPVDIFAAARQETERRNRIGEVVSQTLSAYPGNTQLIDAVESIHKAAVNDRWSLEKLELELMRVTRSIVVNGIHFSGRQPSRVDANVLEAAVAISGRLEDVDKHYDPRVLEVAHKHFGASIGLKELIFHVAQANGYRGPSNTSALTSMLRAAFRPDLYASVGPSGIDISGILSNIANKFLRQGFEAVESSWRAITAIRSVSDFKTITSYSLTGDMTYEQVAPGGELKHGSLGEQSYTNQADTYGKLIGIDRRDLINDDLGALTGVGRRLGRGGALKLNDVFWTEFMDNSSFFTSGRGNYDDGTDTAFGADGLIAAEKLFKALTDPDGKPLGVMPAILLVPPGHRVNAIRLMSSATLAKDSDLGMDNPWAGAFRIVSSVYLSNSSFTGYSALAWYMLADPMDMPVIETAFLNGVETPTVETADMDFDRLGIALRGYHDFGVSKQEYRGGCKFKGEA